MAVHSFKDLVQHHGHDVVVMSYGDSDDIQNVAIECLDCNEVLFNFDKDDESLEEIEKERYIPVKDFAIRKNVSVQSVYKAIKNDRVQSKKIGSYILVRVN